MGARGPRPQPVERKRRVGNPGKRGLPEKGTLRAVVPVDGSVAELTVEQAMERSLVAGKAWFAESDALGIVILREALDFYVELRNDPKAAPKDVIAALKAMSAEAGKCGFNPADRGALGLAEVTAQSKLEELRARRTKVADQGKAG